jgi:hypothetical protein
MASNDQILSKPILSKPTKEHIIDQIIRFDLSGWNVHDCSICGYKCGYRFKITKQNKVLISYDNGCNCMYGARQSRSSSIGELIEHINMQDNENVIQEYNKFWNWNQ